MPDPVSVNGAFNPAHNPFISTATVRGSGLPRLVPDGVEEDPNLEKSEEATRDEQTHASSVVDRLNLSREALEIRELQMRDREVRAHEAAHAAAGGSYAGSPSYTYERGPDGRTYAVGGSVSIDMSPIQGDPQATLQKAQQIRAAALAPAQPSAQDMKVAQKAQAMAAEARNDISQEQMKERERLLDPESSNKIGLSMAQSIASYTRGISDPGPAKLEVYS